MAGLTGALECVWCGEPVAEAEVAWNPRGDACCPEHATTCWACHMTPPHHDRECKVGREEAYDRWAERVLDLGREG